MPGKRIARFRILPCLAFLISACAPALIWTGKSPDRKHDFQIRQSGAYHEVWRDGDRVGRHAGVAPATFAISPDGRAWAYAARTPQAWHLIRNGRDVGEWDGIGDARFSPAGNHLAVTVERGGRWRVIVDEDSGSGPGFDAILEGSLRFDPEGRHCAYAAQLHDKVTVVRDGISGPGYDGVADLAFSPAGRLAYAARKGNRAFAVLEGTEGPPCEAIKELAFLPSGNQIAYIGRREERWYASVEGIESEPYASLHDLVFDREGRYVAFAAGAGAGEFVVQNGIRDQSVFASVRPGSLTYRTGDAKASYVATPDGNRWTVVIGGKIVGTWERVSAFSRSADGMHLGFTARSGALSSVFRDTTRMATEAWAGAPVFGPGATVAYAAIREGRETVIVAGRPFAFDLILEDSLVFGADGTHWGCIAGSRRTKGFFFVIDGARRRDLDVREIVGLNAQGKTQGQETIVRGWVAAEIALAASPSR